MDCPGCKEPMVVLELEEVEIDYCAECGGVWLDAGELELLLEGAEAEERLMNSFACDNKHKEDLVKCPICLKRMEKVSCGEGGKVRLDKCKKNDGIWFDKGELEDVLESAGLDGNDKVLNLLKDMFGRKNLKGE